MDYKTLKVNELTAFPMREIRQDVIDKLKERIESGYNPARPITVIESDGQYLVADGNHRLTVLQGLKTEDVPCVIRQGDPYEIGISCNQDEDTYAPMDLFDWLEIIGKLRSDGLTQSKIGERIGWSREAVKNYKDLLDKIGTSLLGKTKNRQQGRVPQNGTMVPFNFTERWFRDSGLYQLCGEYQQRLIDGFIADKCNWRKAKVQQEAAKYKRWQEFCQIADHPRGRGRNIFVRI